MIQLKKSDSKKFRFESVDQKCIAVIQVRIPNFDKNVATLDVFVVSIDVPPVIKLDDLRQSKLDFENKYGSVLNKKIAGTQSSSI